MSRACSRRPTSWCTRRATRRTVSGVHEALCRGLPAIVSAGAGVAERLPPDLQPLTLPEPLLADDLVARLRLWRGDVGAWRARAAAAGDTLRRRTWDHMAADIAAIVERI